MSLASRLSGCENLQRTLRGETPCRSQIRRQPAMWGQNTGYIVWTDPAGFFGGQWLVVSLDLGTGPARQWCDRSYACHSTKNGRQLDSDQGVKSSGKCVFKSTAAPFDGSFVSSNRSFVRFRNRPESRRSHAPTLTGKVRQSASGPACRFSWVLPLYEYTLGLDFSQN